MPTAIDDGEQRLLQPSHIRDGAQHRGRGRAVIVTAIVVAHANRGRRLGGR